MDFVKSKLKGGGYKFTKQRFYIFKIVCEGRKHMSAYEIYKIAKYNNIGLSTVYRSLEVLDRVGAVRKIDVPGSSYYEVEKLGKYRFHLHGRCIKCNDIIDISTKNILHELKSMVDKINCSERIKIKSSNITFLVICEKCQKRDLDRKKGGTVKC